MDPHQVPLRALRAFERTTGLTVGIYDQQRSFWSWIPPERLLHSHILCRLVKHSRQDLCGNFEGVQVPDALAGLPDGASKVCHVGLVEWTAVVPGEGRPLARLFAGVRRAGRDLRPYIIDRSRTAGGPWERKRAQLPEVSLAESEDLLELLRQLAARLAEWHAHVRPGAAAADAGNDPAAGDARSRIRVIHHWIHARGLERIRLVDLAGRLGISESRAGHVVRAEFGCTFPQLIARYRCTVAASYLRTSDLPLRDVAARSGFPTIAHFHAVFRARYGMSPGEYRERLLEG